MFPALLVVYLCLSRSEGKAIVKYFGESHTNYRRQVPGIPPPIPPIGTPINKYVSQQGRRLPGLLRGCPVQKKQEHRLPTTPLR